MLKLILRLLLWACLAAPSLAMGQTSTEGAPFPVQITNNPSKVLAATASGANQAIVATLTPTATSTAFICGFIATTSGATLGQTTTLSLSGVMGGTATYIMSVPLGVLNVATPLSQIYFPCLPAVAQNTPISLSMSSAGVGNTSQNLQVWGYWR